VVSGRNVSEATESPDAATRRECSRRRSRRSFEKVPRLTVEVVICSERGVLPARRIGGPFDGMGNIPGRTVRFAEPRPAGPRLASWVAFGAHLAPPGSAALATRQICSTGSPDSPTRCTPSNGPSCEFTGWSTETRRDHLYPVTTPFSDLQAGGFIDLQQHTRVAGHRNLSIVRGFRSTND